MNNKLLLVFLLSGFLFSCGTTEKLEQTDEAVKEATLVDSFDDYKNSAITNIQEVELNGNVLSFKVSYSGGCETHNFELLGSKRLGKTLPPKRSVMLYHNSNGDNCRQLITETLHFNILSLGYKKDEHIDLLIEGWDSPIRYTLR